MSEPPAFYRRRQSSTPLLNVRTLRSSTEAACFQFAVAVASSHRDVFRSLGLTGSHLSRSRKPIVGAIPPSLLCFSLLFKALLSCISGVSFINIFREQNMVADQLAKSSISRPIPLIAWL
ncbi:hypothetical protein L1049_019816 [Liquidambar formosana]|uniref:Uncharacterized protein n=1 Tax=Liquidambar formosana TaxID=63359 RepID=A0AAP0X5J2_LIQFO